MVNILDERADYLRSISEHPSLLQGLVIELIDQLGSPPDDAEELLELFQKSQRVKMIYEAGVENDAELLEQLSQSSEPLWSETEVLPVDPKLLEKLGDQLFKSNNPNQDDHVIMRIDENSKVLGETLVQHCQDEGLTFDVEFSDNAFKTTLINSLPNDVVEQLAESFKQKLEPVTKSIVGYAQIKPSIAEQQDKEKFEIYRRGMNDFYDKLGSGEIFYTLTLVPTEEDAALDQIPYEEYLQLFFELCDQPWDEIKEAQAILIEKFDAATELHITNDDGTDVTLKLRGIDQDGQFQNMTFANSVIDKNIPGSEIFSAPLKYGVDGVIVAKGRFRYDGPIIEDMRFEIVEGKVISYSAEVGEEHLINIIETDEGSKFVGEIGIGTNPHLRQHVVNGLLVEKIPGSFHLAFGACYTYEEYGGVPVNLKNGNESDVHWDVTTMLRDHGGRMYLDGELVQKDGEWLEEEFKVLNEGWKAIPEEQRPEYWNDKIAKEQEEQGRHTSAQLARRDCGGRENFR